jgi:hypothetical protein
MARVYELHLILHAPMGRMLAVLDFVWRFPSQEYISRTLRLYPLVESSEALP